MSTINSFPTPSFAELRDKLLPLYQGNKENETKENYKFDASSFDKLLQEIKTEDYNIINALFYILILLKKNGYNKMGISFTSIKTIENKIKKDFISYMKANAETLPVEAWDTLILFYLVFILCYEDFPYSLVKKIISQMFKTSPAMRPLYIKAIKNMFKNQWIINDEQNENKFEDDIDVSDEQKIFLIKNILSKISKKGRFVIKVNSTIIDALVKAGCTNIIDTILSYPNKYVIIDDECYKKISILALSNDKIKEKFKRLKGRYTDEQKIYIEFLKRYIKFNEPIKANNLLEKYSISPYSYNHIDIKKLIQENNKVTNEEILRYINLLSTYSKDYKKVPLEELIKMTASIIPLENLNINIRN